MDLDLASFTAPHPIPVRTGMTIGEFGKMVAAERKINVSLTVVPLEGWDRGRWFDETWLPWVNPVAQHPLGHPGAALLRRRLAGSHQPVGRAGDRHAVRGGGRAVDRALWSGGRRAERSAAAGRAVRARGLHADRAIATRDIAVRRGAARRHRSRGASGRSRSGWPLGRALRERSPRAVQGRGHPAPPGEPVHDLGASCGEPLPRVMAWAEMAAHELPESPRVIPHLLI